MELERATAVSQNGLGGVCGEEFDGRSAGSGGSCCHGGLAADVYEYFDHGTGLVGRSD